MTLFVENSKDGCCLVKQVDEYLTVPELPGGKQRPPAFGVDPLADSIP